MTNSLWKFLLNWISDSLFTNSDLECSKIKRDKINFYCCVKFCYHNYLKYFDCYCYYFLVYKDSACLTSQYFIPDFLIFVNSNFTIFQIDEKLRFLKSEELQKG